MNQKSEVGMLDSQLQIDRRSDYGNAYKSSPFDNWLRNTVCPQRRKGDRLLSRSDQLGLKVKLKEGNWVELDTGKTILALHVDEKAEFPAEPKGPTCVVFNVEDIYATYEHLKSAGVKFEEEPKQVCEMGPGQIGVSADFRDLDENLLSIFGAVKKK
jgi:hypothetical protein